jgi:4-amino-4-deoxy-L-arabinose transferase-like glycosyltransferase
MPHGGDPRAAGWDRVAPALIFLCAAVAFAIGIAELPVIDRDEARFAQAARQMVATGDYIDIRFQDGPRHNKPAGIYWLQAGMLHLFGDAGIWVHRLVSVLAGSLAAVALIWAGGPLVGRRASIWAAVMLATLFMLQAEARIAKTDAALLLTVILAMGALARVWMDRTVSRWIAAAFWTALAAGFLIKGPIILMPVGGALIWLSIRERGIGWLAGLRPLPGLAGFIALAAPWYIAIIAITDGSFLADSLGRDLTEKVTTTNEADGTPPGSYLIAFWLTFWPWTVLAPFGAVWAWRSRRSAATVFLLAWAIPLWVAFELIPTKLVHYTLPAYPALALICGAAFGELLEGKRFSGWPAHLGTTGFALVSMGFAALILWGPMEYGAGPGALGWAGVIAALALALAAILALYRGHIARGAWAVAGCGLVMGWTLFAVTLPSLAELWITPRLVAATEAQPCLIGPVAMVGFREPSTVFLFGTDTRLSNGPDAMTWLAEGPGRAAWIAVSELDALGLQPTPGIPNVTEVSGINYSNGTPVALRLVVSPGVLASPTPCG